MTITEIILNEEAAMKAALERSYGKISLCTRHPEGSLDKDLTAFDFDLFNVPFRVRIDDIRGVRRVGFAPTGNH